MKKAIPNILSGFRIVAAPFLLCLAWLGYRNLFLILLSVSLLTDAIDGYLSRKLNVTSDFGSRLDSWGDMATYLTIPLCAWWLWPEIIKEEAIYVVIVIGAYIIPIIAGLLKFRRIPSYHTWGSKIAAFIMSTSVLILFVTGMAWPFRCAAMFQVLVACEGVLITSQLNELQSNIPSIWHVKLFQKKMKK